jgi:hypothetical protein
MARVDAYFNFQVIASAQENILSNLKNIESKICNSYRVVLVQEIRVNFTVCGLETSTCQEPLADALNFLDTMLVAKIIKLLEDLVNRSNQFFGLVGRYHLIKVFNDDVDYCGLSLLIRIIFLSERNLISNQRWHKHIKNLLKLDVSLDPGVAPHELYLLLQLLKVDIGGPAAGNKDPHRGPIALHCLIDLEPIANKRKKDEHEDGEHDHRYGRIDIGMVKPGHQRQHKNKPHRLQALAGRRIHRVAGNHHYCVSQQQLGNIQLDVRYDQEHARAEEAQNDVVVNADVGKVKDHV